MPGKHETTLRKRLTNDCKKPVEVPIDDLQQLFSKFRVQRTMLSPSLAQSESKPAPSDMMEKMKARARSGFFRKARWQPFDGTLQRLDSENIRLLRQMILGVIDLVESALLRINIELGLVRRRRIVIAAVRRCWWGKRGRVGHMQEFK